MPFQGRLSEGVEDSNQSKYIEETLKRVRLILASNDAQLRYTWIYNTPSDFRSQDLLGKRDDEVQPNAAGRTLYELKQQVLATGRAARHTVHFPMADGTHVYDIVLDALRNDTGEVIGVVSASFDITEFVAEDRTWRETEALIRSLFESAPIGLGVWDRDIRFLRINQALADINGMPSEYHIGKRPSEILPEIKDIHNLEDLLRSVMQSGKPAMDIEVYGNTPADLSIAGVNSPKVPR